MLETLKRMWGIRSRPAENPPPEFPADFSPAEIRIIRSVRPFTMTSNERLYALIQAVRYLERVEIPGDFAECGVWKGGSMMACALTLLEAGRSQRNLHLFDTFEGMPPPGIVDVDQMNIPAGKLYEQFQSRSEGKGWCKASAEEVAANLDSTGYPKDRLHLVRGLVEETIPRHAPERLALLRLDTDWYASTRHELIHLFPLLAPGGVLIIDDYGYWSGCRKAVDEYFENYRPPMLLQRIDETGRLLIKVAT